MFFRADLERDRMDLRQETDTWQNTSGKPFNFRYILLVSKLPTVYMNAGKRMKRTVDSTEFPPLIQYTCMFREKEAVKKGLFDCMIFA